MKKIGKVFFIIISVLAFIVFVGGISNLNRSNKEDVPINDTQNEITNNEEVPVPIKEENLKDWKGHELGEYEFVLTNESYAIVVRKIDEVEDTIRLTYTFINESGDDTSAIWNFQCVPYQNGTSLNDNKKYSRHYYKCENEQTSVRSGYSIDDCWNLIPIGDGSEIECDIGAGMWNETHLFKINPQTMEWSIEEK